ncbi:MAG: BACON domain-containing protein [Bacteroidaceae bacterium]|nr:BACON domain-containing protein [Bacteroidaceae bacterium]
MKHILRLMALSIAVFALASCSDDDKVGFNVNEGTDIVSINRLGGMVEIPVTASGDWTATISGNEMDGLVWSEVRQKQGTGSAQLIVYVDYLDPKLQMQERKAQVTVKSGDETQVITVRQYIGLKDGETADNDETTYYSDVWFSKGVGKGFDPKSGDVSSSFVLNTKYLIKLAEKAEKPEYSSLFAQEILPAMEVGAILNDTLSNNFDSIGVSCNITVKYAQFKMSLDVKYQNSGKIVEHQALYTGSQDLECLRSTVSSANVKAMLEAYWRDGSYADIIDSLVSIGFKAGWTDVMNSYQTTTSDSSDFHGAIDDLLYSFGPVYIEGATLGGSIFTAIEYDSLYVENNFNIHGKLTGSVALAAISITAGVDVDYSTVGADIWQNSRFYCAISGGDKSSYDAMLEQLNSNTPDRDTLRAAAQKWMESIRSTNDSDDNTAVIKIKCTGIWHLFPRRVADAMKAYIKNKYKGQELCIDLQHMD